jgi:ribosomal protein L11 methyltransferase
MWQLSFMASLAQVEQITSQLEEWCLSISWFEKDALLKVWHVEANFEEKPDEKHLKHIFKELSYELELLPQIDWLKENRKSFPPLDIGPFYIYGSHHEERLPDRKIAFKIDAATAFGTGHHATTQGCLLALNELKESGLKVYNYLDLGCGTAILAMAMACLFEVKGIAADNDPEALETAYLNIKLNHLDTWIQILESEGFSHGEVRAQAPYDLITANILAEPLISLASDMRRFLKPQGRIILSGLLQTQQPEVARAYEAQGFSIAKTHPIGEWLTVVLRKTDHDSRD